jgi:hypothetical protein
VSPILQLQERAAFQIAEMFSKFHSSELVLKHLLVLNIV